MSIPEKLTTIAENEQKVYEAGRYTGQDEARIEWWNNMSNNGKRTEWPYSCQYLDLSWLEGQQNIYTVKDSMYRMFQYYRGEIIPGVFDCSAVTNAGHAFRYNGKLKISPDLNIPALGSYDGTWQSSAMEIIEMVRCHENTSFSATFSDCPNLKNVTFEGVIGRNISFSTSPLLSRETLLSNGGDGVFGKLKDYSGAGTTYTITLHADTKALLSDAEKAIATEKGWTIA